MKTSGILMMVVFAWFSGYCINSNPKVRKITTEKGLSNNIVYGITQDKQGFMWFVTEDGINKYDGNTITTFRHDEENKKSISNNFTQSIYCDKNNDIWIATDDGLNRYDHTKEIFFSYFHDPKDPFSISNNDIIAVTPAMDGNLWVASYREGINYLDKKSHHFYSIKGLSRSSKSSDYLKVLCILEDRNGILWVGTQGNGLIAYNVANKKRKLFLNSNNKLSITSNDIRSIYQDSFNKIWIGTSKGLMTYNSGTGQFQEVKQLKAINNRVIHTIHETKNGDLWIGTDNGIVKFNIKKYWSSQPTEIQYINESQQEDGLSFRSIRAIFQDRDDNIWIGTYTGGVNFISSSKLKFKLMQHDPINNNSLTYNKIWGMCEDKKGNFWIGTDGSGLNKIDHNTKAVTHFTHKAGNPNTISDNAILSALCSSDGLLWFGTYAGGLNKYNPKTNQFIHYLSDPLKKTSLSGNDVRCIYEDFSKNIWICTKGGLSLYNSKTNDFINYNTSNSGLSYDGTRSIVQDKKGGFWVGTYGEGLNYFEPTKNRVKIYRHEDKNPKSIRNNTIHSLFLDRKGRLWIGTGGGGLNLYIPEKKEFLAFMEKDGLSNNNVMAINEDKEGILWVSTNSGLSKFNPDKHIFENFNFYDGLQSGQFMAGSTIYSQEGYMCFGGTGGLNLFYPHEVFKDNFSPKVLITNFLLFNQPVSIRSEKSPDSPLETNITECRKIILNHRQSVFTFDFVALNYSLPEKTQYKYIMEGAEQQWNFVGNKRSATYRNLSPGTYHFKVNGTNQDGIWSKNTAQIEVVIEPAFWNTWWAKIIYFLLFFYLLFWGWRISTFQIRERNKLKLEKLERLKAEEINQAKIDFYTNISHEFRTPLTLIVGPLEKLISSDSDINQKKQFNMMHRNVNRLLRLVNQLMDMTKIEQGQVKLNVQLIDIIMFIKDITYSFEELSLQKNIILKFSSDFEQLPVWIDLEKMDKIIFNLLSNSYKFTPNGGNISITLSKKTDKSNPVYLREYLEILVSDSGKGIQEVHFNKIFERFYQIKGSQENAPQKGNGIGLHLTRSLVEMHHGIITVTSQVGIGTVFTIKLPLGKSHLQKDEFAIDSEHSSIHNYPLNLIENENFLTEIPSQTEKSKKNFKILIVEDDFEIRNYIKSELIDEYEIEEAVNGMEGLKKAVDYQPDIVISDVMMPEMDGMTLCRMLKTDLQTCHIPIILLTAKTTIEQRIEGIETGADSYIPKPFHPQHLKTRIAKLIELRETLKTKFSTNLTFDVKDVVPTSPDEKFLRKAVDLVKENIIDSDFSIDYLSRQLGMSRSNLHRKLKALTNQSTSDFVRNIRLKQAAFLLCESKLNVSEVCYEVGFSSPSYFTSCFTAHFKMSPTEFVQRNKNSKG